MTKETNKPYSKEEDVEIWSSIAEYVFDKYSEDRTRMTEVQSVVTDIWIAEGLIGNGGLWYGSFSEEDLINWIHSYKILKLSECAEVLEEALNILPPEDSEEDDELSDRLTELEEIFYDEDDHVASVVATYIRNNLDDAKK